MSSSEGRLEIRRYQPFAAALACLVFGLACFELLVGGLLGFSPKFLWTGTVPNEWYDGRNNGRAVAGAELARLRDSSRGLGLAVGASTTRYALTPRALDRCDGLDLDWLVMTSTRMSFTVMEENVFQPLELSPALARPRVIALHIHPEMLVGATEGVPTFAEASSAVTDAVRRRRWREAAEALGRASFIVHIRGRVANTAEQLVNRLRLGVLKALSQPLYAVYAPPIDMAADRIPVDGNSLKFFPDKVIQGYLEKWNALGFGDPARYSAKGEQADALRRIVHRYPGVPLVFVIMPVRSEFRSATAAPAIAAVWEQLFEEFAATRPVTVVDLSDRLPNDAFKDVGHANLRGRAELQRLVPRALSLAAGGSRPVPGDCSTSKPLELRRIKPR
jgi:hypothetical protein